MTLKERIENNPVIWLLSALVAGFTAGIACYQSILTIAQLQVISRAEYQSLTESASKTSGGVRSAGNTESNSRTQTLTDSRTGLMWALTSSPKMNWKQTTRYCDGLDIGGYSDWRLPTKAELETLIYPRLSEEGEYVRIADDDPLGQIVPRHDLFQAPQGYIFSSTLVDPDEPYVMNPSNGHIFNGGGERGVVRAVREVKKF